MICVQNIHKTTRYTILEREQVYSLPFHSLSSQYYTQQILKHNTAFSPFWITIPSNTFSISISTNRWIFNDIEYVIYSFTLTVRRKLITALNNHTI